MDIHTITQAISSSQDRSAVSEHELQALINQYPFASALYAMRSRGQVELDRLSPKALGESALHFCNSESFIKHCIAGTESDLQDELKPLTNDTIELPTKEQSAVITNDQPSMLKDPSNLALQIEEATGQDADIDLIQKDEQVDEKLKPHAETEEPNKEITHEEELNVESESDESLSKAENPLLNLAHLSDYGSWLLQLKNKQSSPTIVVPADVQASDLIDSPSDRRTAIDQSGEELIEPTKSSQKIDVSSRLNDQIASESLANLLAEQGYYTKAIDMYKKLSLIIPEKSTYFATQIEKIKGK